MANSKDPDEMWHKVAFRQALYCLPRQKYCSGTDGNLSYDVPLGSEITPCNKFDKPQVVNRFAGNVMTSITTLRT